MFGSDADRGDRLHSLGDCECGITSGGARFETVRQHGGISAKTSLVMAYVMTLCVALLIWAMIWAIAFLSLDAITEFRQAVCFSVVTLTTLGYGDLVPHENAQLVAVFCAIAGLFLMGLSTAFIIEIRR
ncbi:MAG: potassium channel family protein [Pseudomonadota bacterium]